MDLNILILLLYYNRPQMVKNALASIQYSSYKNYNLFIHDDNSNVPLTTSLPHTYYKNQDPMELKLERGSSLGLVVNNILDTTTSHVAIMLCDDDALHPDYLKNLNDYFNKNLEVNSCFSNVITYDPLIEPYSAAINRKVNFNDCLNAYTNPIMPSFNVDASQVAWRTTCPARFPPFQEKNHDASFYKELEQCGPAHYTGFISQFKGVHKQQLGNMSFKASLK